MHAQSVQATVTQLHSWNGQCYRTACTFFYADVSYTDKQGLSHSAQINAGDTNGADQPHEKASLKVADSVNILAIPSEKKARRNDLYLLFMGPLTLSILGVMLLIFYFICSKISKYFGR